MQDSLKSFGFTHLYEGRQFSFAVAAGNAEEARELVQSMAGAELAGELRQACMVNPQPSQTSTVNPAAL